MSKPSREWLENTMRALDCSEEDALEMWEDDEDIEAGEAKDFDLTPEQEKQSKKYRQTTSKEKKTVKRERKPNEEKREIINNLYAAIYDWEPEFVSDVKTVNPERQIDFVVNGNHYSITLTCHRPPKEKKGDA